MGKQLKHICFLLVLFIAASCGNTEDPTQKGSGGSRFFKDVKPESNGGMLEVLVVAEDEVWDSPVGNAVKEILIPPQYGLPQPEAKYVMSRIRPESFNDLLKRSRNIVVLNAKADGASFSQEKNRWAKPQHVYHFAGANTLDLAKIIKKEGAAFEKDLRKHEIARLQGAGKKETYKNPESLASLGYKINIPKAYDAEVQDENFLMYWKQTRQSDQGIFIHVRPMPAQDGPVGADIIPLRDSITKIYYPGSHEGSYMKTETLIAPQMKSTEVDNMYAMESRGLWRTEGDLLGGPFLSYTIYDDKNNRIITLDAFVLAPELNKRNLLLEQEAILKSFRRTN